MLGSSRGYMRRELHAELWALWTHQVSREEQGKLAESMVWMRDTVRT